MSDASCDCTANKFDFPSKTSLFRVAMLHSVLNPSSARLSKVLTASVTERAAEELPFLGGFLELKELLQPRRVVAGAEKLLVRIVFRGRDFVPMFRLIFEGDFFLSVMITVLPPALLLDR